MTTAADLTPEDAADVLTALTDIENETEQANYAAAVEAEAQRAFEEEERRPGVEETRAPSVFSYDVRNVEFTVGTDGALTVYAVRRDEPAYGLRPDDTYALYIFLAKLPHVGPLLERAHTERQYFLYGDMENKKNDEGFDCVPSIVSHLAKVRAKGRYEAIELVLAKLEEEKVKRQEAKRAA